MPARWRCDDCGKPYPSLREAERCEARHFIDRAIAEEVRAGYPRPQAIAIAYSRARKAGHRVGATKR